MTDDAVALSEEVKAWPDRARFWRKFVALGTDLLIALVVAQLVVALLFALTNGAVQGRFWFALKFCGPVTSSSLLPAPSGITFVEDCSDTVFGLPIARTVALRNEADGPEAKLQHFVLTRDGAPSERLIEVGWLTLGVLVLYLILFETRDGTTFGKRLLQIRVADVRQPQTKRIPLKSAVVRTLALLPPLIWFFDTSVSIDVTRVVGNPLPGLSFELHIGALFVLALVWVAMIAASVSKEPIHDRLAGSTVLEDEAVA